MKHCIRCRQPLSATNTRPSFFKHYYYVCAFCHNRDNNNRYQARLGTPLGIRHIIRSMATRRKQSITQEYVEKLALQLYAMLIETPYCLYTGRKLMPGKNLHLDHKTPASKAPKRLFDIKNLQWVDSQYNRAKNNMTDKQFLRFCRLIVSRADQIK